MRSATIILGLFLLPALAGCADEQPGPPLPLKSFVLHDVQGLFGGQTIWAAEDRMAFVQIVGPAPEGKAGLWEKRYKFKLTDEQWAVVEKLVGAHHFLTLRVPERPAQPDEAHPIIVVVTRDGITAKAKKLAGDKHPDFDSVYDHLLELCRSKGELVHEGPFDWNWHPDGFDKLW